MSTSFRWTNRSVLAFSEGLDPVFAMEKRARSLVLRAMDAGWDGPPFDPLALARWLKVRTEACGNIPDARMVPGEGSQVVLEYNPMRPRGRLRFSIAHEIAHFLFADCGERIRNRGGDLAASDDWQLEVLCNIGAAELLMPLGSFSELADKELSIDSVLNLRKQFDVSVEACIIRLIKLSSAPSAAFCASKHADGHYRMDYIIPASGWKSPIRTGQSLSNTGVVAEANAIGYTAKGLESWDEREPLHVECIGLAPYPGSIVPRVVGIIRPSKPSQYKPPTVTEVVGSALEPRGSGPRIIAHVVPDTQKIWGGAGFASKVRRTFPDAWLHFKAATSGKGKAPDLGKVVVVPVGEQVSVAHMIAQHGIGPSANQRLSYSALEQCLSQVRTRAQELGASVHMPRVGTGHGGANWDVVKELI